MSHPTSPILFYSSGLCPRCMLARKELRRLRREHPELAVVEIDVAAHPLRAWRAGIRMIPALQAGGDLLSGILLTAGDIRNFVSRHLARSAPKQPLS